MSIRTGEGFAAPQINSQIITDLGLVKEETALGYSKAYQDLTKDSVVAQLEAAGQVSRTGTEEYGMWFSNTKPRNKFTVTDDVSFIDSGEETVTIDTYVNSDGNLSAPAVGLFFRDNISGEEFEVLEVDKSTDGAHTAVIKPTSSGVDVDITAEDSEFISFGRPTAQEASFQQDGEYKAWDKRLNNIRIIRTNKQWTDLATMLDVQVREDGTTYYDLDRSGFPKEHIDVKELELMMGGERDNVTSEGNRSVGGMGFIPLVQNYGTSIDGGGSGAALDLTLFRNIARVIDGNGLSSSYNGLADTEAMFQIQEFLLTNDVRTQQVASGDELKAIFDYNTNFVLDGIEYSFKKYNYWNADRLAGASSTNSFLSNQILLMPNGGVENGEGKYQPFMQLRYLDNNIFTDGGVFNKFDDGGALAGHGTTRNLKVSLTSYMGADIMGIEGFIYLKLSS